MKTIAFSAALFLLAAFSAHAQIGATLEQCTQHFGKPTRGPDPTDGSCTFIVGKIFVAAMFHDGTADYLMFGRRGHGGRGEMPLTNTEIAALMNDNAGGRKWLLNADPAGGWVTDDGTIFASKMKSGGGLVIQTKDRKDRDATATSTPAGAAK
ncbi:MAG TPA: hypothetical protein VGM54_18485 [Chthoniobacter sp.]|jgi:hypothetical protein